MGNMNFFGIITFYSNNITLSIQQQHMEPSMADHGKNTAGRSFGKPVAVLASVLSMTFSVPTIAQQAPPTQLAAPGPDARIGFLVEEHGLSEAAAAEQLALTDRFQVEIDQLITTFPDSYLKTIYHYGTPFRIDVVFSRDVAANELTRAVPSELRRSVKVQRSRFTRAEIMEGKESILALVTPVLDSVGVSFDFEQDRFTIFVIDDAAEKTAKSLLTPDLRTMVTFGRGPGETEAGFNTPADDPTHSGKGSIWGGWPLRVQDAYSSAVCSSSFIVMDTTANQPQLLTAGHCGTGAMSVRWSDGTMKSMGSPLYRANGGNADIQTRWGAFLTTDGYFWIDNDVSGSFQYDCDVAGNNCKTKNWRNVYGGVSTAGYVAVTDAVKGNSWSSYGWNDNHPVNDIVCKHGMMTGVTCGRIVDSEYDYEGEGVTYTNLVRVLVNDSWDAAGSKGDSGGSVFKITNTSGTFAQATAVGVISGGTFAGNGTLRGYAPCSASIRGQCHVIYTPIDRINDNNRPLAIDPAGSGTPIDVN